LLAISSFICAVAFFGFEHIGYVGNLIMFWAPVGILISGMLIIYGKPAGYKHPLTIAVFSGFAVLSLTYIANILANGKLIPLLDTVNVTSFLISVLLLFAIGVYLKVYRLVPDSRQKIIFLICGMFITIVGLMGLVATSPNNVLGIHGAMELQPYFGITVNIGILVAAIAFTNIPARLELKTTMIPSTETHPTSTR
jgi:hypothetical protein